MRNLMIKGIVPVIIILTFVSVVVADQPDKTPLEMPELPMTFVSNQGQIEADVDYYVRGLSGIVYFSKTEITLALPNEDIDTDRHVLTLHHVNANPNPQIDGWQGLRGKVNFFSGSDSEEWLINIPTYAGVEYRTLYSGVDVIYDGVDGVLKGTYYVDAGVSPDVIRWEYDGIESVTIDTATGNLELFFADDEVLIEHAPIAWQEIDGERVVVDASYELDGSTVGFTVGEYDPNYELVIDPVLEYSTYIGGSNPDTAWGIDVDDDGYAYVVGEADSVDFPGIDANSVDNVFDQSNESFVIKIDTNTFGADSLVWSTYINASEAVDVAVDDDGDVYVVGTTAFTDFPVVNGFETERGQGQCCTSDAFLAKISSDGTQILYSTFIGGTSSDQGGGIAVDSNENAYVGGETRSITFPITANAYRTTPPTNQFDLFITKINTTVSGTDSLVYSTFIGGSANGDNLSGGLAADDDGNVYLSGRAQSLDFPVTANAFQPTVNVADAYISRIDTNISGTAGLVYSTYYGGSSLENHNNKTGDTATDGNGIVYVTGETMSSDLPIVNGFDSTFGGGSADGFVAVFDTNAYGAASLLYSTYLGGSQFDQGYGIAATRNGNVYITGQSQSSNFPTRDAIQSYGGSTGSFVTKIDTTLVGNDSLIYSTFLGRNGNGFGGAAVDGLGTAYVAGQIAQNDFPIVGGFQSDYAGNTDGYMAKLSFRSDIEITKTATPETTIIGEPLIINIDVQGKGPEVATGVLVTEVIPESIFVIDSVSPTQGSCELFPSVVFCKMGNLKKGQTESILIIANPISTTDSGGAPLNSPVIGAIDEFSDQNGSPRKALSAPNDDTVAVVATVDGVEEDLNPDNNTVERNIAVYTFDTYLPSLLTPENTGQINDSLPQLEWEAIVGADYYEIQLSRIDVTVVDIVGVVDTSYTPPSDLLSTEYEWRVRGVRAVDEPTQWSSIYTFTVEASQNASPILNIYNTSTPILTWNRVTWATAYEVEIATDSRFNNIVAVSGTLDASTLSYTPSSLNNNQRFYWRVRARNVDDVWGTWSDEGNFMVSY